MARPQLTTLDDGNPAAALRNVYDRLMAIEDPVILEELVRGTVQASKISKANLRFFERSLEKCQRNVGKIQSYVTNYLLKADGFGVIR